MPSLSLYSSPMLNWADRAGCNRLHDQRLCQTGPASRRLGGNETCYSVVPRQTQSTAGRAGCTDSCWRISPLCDVTSFLLRKQPFVCVLLQAASVPLGDCSIG